MSSRSLAQTLPVRPGAPGNTENAVKAGRRRSWMMTFSDILLQLLAFFIMRFAIAPYRLGAAPKPAPLPAAPAVEEPALPHPKVKEGVRHLRLLNFRSLALVDGIEAELQKNTLPERVDEMSFSLSEDLATLGATFGGGNYLITLSESRCGGGERLSKTAIIAEELIQKGVPPECLQWGEENPCNTENSQGAMSIAIVEKKCDPFGSGPGSRERLADTVPPQAD